MLTETPQFGPRVCTHFSCVFDRVPIGQQGPKWYWECTAVGFRWVKAVVDDLKKTDDSEATDRLIKQVRLPAAHRSTVMPHNFRHAVLRIMAIEHRCMLVVATALRRR